MREVFLSLPLGVFPFFHRYGNDGGGVGIIYLGCLLKR